MVPLSIIGMPQVGKPSFPLFAVHAPWLSSSGLRPLRVVRHGEGDGQAAPPPPRVWLPPCRPHGVPHAVLTPSRFLLRPRLLTRPAAMVRDTGGRKGTA